MTKKGKETDNKMKNQCPICKKEFENLRLHETKAHKKDMWKFVIPKKLTDKSKVSLYNFEKLIGSVSGESGSDDAPFLLYFFDTKSANTIKNVESVTIKIYLEEDEDKPSNKIKPVIEYYIEDKDGEAKLKPVDNNNVTIEYEEKANKKTEEKPKEEKEECSICKKMFKNLALHETKAHKKDMWKVVVPKNLNEESPKLYNFGRKMRAFDDVQVNKENNGNEHWYYSMYEIEANTIKNVTAITIGIFTDEDGNVLKKELIDFEYEITDKHGSAEYKPADKNNTSIEFA